MLVLRLFIALKPPAPIIDALLAAMSGITAARWQTAEALHVTLDFLGNVDPRRLEALDDSLRRALSPPVLLRCQGVGYFTTAGRANSVWAAAGPQEQLRQLSDAVRGAATAAGVASASGPYIPHITMARLNARSGPIDDFMAKNADLTTPACLVSEFALYQSTIGPEGSHYSQIASYPLR